MNPRPRRVRRGTTLDAAMDLMEDLDVRHLVVEDDQGLAGVISDRDLLEATGWLSPRQREVIEAPGGRVGDFMVDDVASVSPGAPLDDALGLMTQRRIGCLPVVTDGKVVGLLTEVDLLRAYVDACRRGQVPPEADATLEDVLTPDPLTLAPDDSGEEAARCLRSFGVRHLPVLYEGRLVGIVSDRDVRRERGRGQLEFELVEELMSSDVAVGTCDQRLSSAAAILVDERVGALPVVDGDDLVGIASTIDVMLACAEVLQGD